MKRNIIFLLVLLTSACSTKLDFKEPGNRFYTPESIGEKRKFQAGYLFAHGVNTTLTEVYRPSIFSDRTNIIAEPTLDKTRGLGAHGAFALIDDLDIELAINHDSPFLLGLKYQLVGTGNFKKETGFKMSIGAGFGMDSEDITTSSTDNSEAREYSSEVDLTKFNFYTSMGYRFEDSFLLYLSGHYTDISVKSEVTSTNGQFNAFTNEESQISQGINLGLKVDITDFLFIIGEVGRQKVVFARDYSLYTTPIGISLAYTNI